MLVPILRLQTNSFYRLQHVGSNPVWDLDLICLSVTQEGTHVETFPGNLAV
jgi:hypothetical protein